MQAVEWIAVIQTNSPESESGGGTDISGYLVFAMVACTLALVVWMMIRTSTRRSQKR